ACHPAVRDRRSRLAAVLAKWRPSEAPLPLARGRGRRRRALSTQREPYGRATARGARSPATVEAGRSSSDVALADTLSTVTTPRLADRVGRVLGGRFRLVSPIGSGASAHVFLAHDVVLGRRVAVKVLHPALAGALPFLPR